MKKDLIILIFLIIIYVSLVLLLSPKNQNNTTLEEEEENIAMTIQEQEQNEKNNIIEVDDIVEENLIEEQVEERNEILYTQVNVNIRTEPDHSNKENIIKVLSCNTQVVSIAAENGWNKIRLDDSTIGYIKSNLLSKEKKKIIQNTQQQKQVKEQKTNNNESYLGDYVITAYCGCSKCSDGWGNQTASGVYPVEGVTIAAPKDFKFGTKIKINNHIYTVQDRGGAIKGKRIDIYFNSHSECLNFGKKTLPIYRVD